MNRPNTPSAPPLYSGPPSYGDDNISTPTDESTNQSQIRLLTSMDDSNRSYVIKPLNLLPKPLAIPSLFRKGKHSMSSEDEAEEVNSTCKVQTSSTEEKIVQFFLPKLPDGPSRRLSLRSQIRSPRKPVGSLPKVTNSPTTPRRYQPSIISSHSRAPSIIDDGIHMPEPEASYNPYSPSGRMSPTRSWSPSRGSSELGRPPPLAAFEPADINGSPRPGTPSSRYGGSPRRPLPPAPLFTGPGARTSTFTDDATVSIPLEDDDDVFGPQDDGDLGSDPRKGLQSRGSYMTDSTYTEDQYIK